MQNNHSTCRVDASTAMMDAGRPSTPLLRSATQGVDGGPSAIMTRRGGRAGPDGSVISARAQSIELRAQRPRCRMPLGFANGNAVSQRSIVSLSLWMGVTRPSALRRRGVDGRDTPGHDGGATSRVQPRTTPCQTLVPRSAFASTQRHKATKFYTNIQTPQYRRSPKKNSVALRRPRSVSVLKNQQPTPHDPSQRPPPHDPQATPPPAPPTATTGSPRQ